MRQHYEPIAMAAAIAWAMRTLTGWKRQTGHGELTIKVMYGNIVLCSKEEQFKQLSAEGGVVAERFNRVSALTADEGHGNGNARSGF